MPVQGINIEVPEGKEFELLPKDVYQAELLDIDQKMQNKYQSDEQEEVLVFQFVILEKGDHYGRQMWKYCTPKLSKYNGGSNLYKVLVGLNGGKELSDDAFENPHVTLSDEKLNALIGKQVRLSVGQKAKQDKTMKNVIDAFLPVKEELPAYVKSEEKEKDLSEEVDFDA